MKRKRIRTVVTVVVSLTVAMLAVSGGRAIYAQDTAQAKYTVQVPNGLAFSEFRGYESWQTVSISPVPFLPLPPAPGWRRSIGTRKSWRRSPVRWCPEPCMTSTSW